MGSTDPWVLSSIWRAAVSHAALQRGYQDRSHASETVSGAHLRVMTEGLSWLLPINPFEPFVSADSIGSFLGIESLILEIAVQTGGWRCPSCEEMVFRDSIARMEEILSMAGEGTVVCVVPRGKESPPLRQLAEFFEAARVVVGEQIIPLTECDDDSVLARDGFGVVVASRGGALTTNEATDWLVEQCARHPCRLDVGVTRGGTGVWHRVGSIGSTARCMNCGASSEPPTLRELRKVLRAGGNAATNIALLDTSLDTVLAGSLIAAAEIVGRIIDSGAIGGVDSAFLERMISVEDPLFRSPVTFPLKRLSPTEFVRLAVLRAWCAGVTGVQVVVDQLSEDDVSNLVSSGPLQRIITSMGGMICLSREEGDREPPIRERVAPLPTVQEQTVATLASDLLPEIVAGTVVQVTVSDEQLRKPEQLVESVAAALRAERHRIAVVRCSPEEIFGRSGEVGEVSGLYRLLAELGARLPARRFLGLSELEILSGLRGERDLPATLFGVSSSEVRDLPLKQLIQRLPRVGEAHAVARWIVAAQGEKVTISEESRGHPPGLRVIYAISHELPLKKRCLAAIQLRPFLSVTQQRIVEAIFSEQVTGAGGGGRVVWFEKG